LRMPATDQTFHEKAWIAWEQKTEGLVQTHEVNTSG